MTAKDPFDLIRLPVEDTPFEKILPYPKNHKNHSPVQIEKLKNSILKLGLMDPIIVDKDGYIIAGHGRFEAIKKMRDEDPARFKIVPVKWARHLTDTEAVAARIASNKLSSNDYNVEFLQGEIDLIRESGDLDIDISDMILDSKEVEMFTKDMGDLNFDALTEDLGEELTRQDEDNESAVADADASDTPLAKAFGFSKISNGAVKTVDRFMATIQSETGKTGADALLDHMEKYLDR